MKFNGDIVLLASGNGRIENLHVEKGASNPTGQVSGNEGRVFFNTADKKFYYWDSTSWVTFATGGNAAALQTEVDAIETTIGAAIDANGEFVQSAFSSFTNVTSPTDLTNVLSQLDAAISGKDALDELVDVNIDSAATGHVLVYNATSSMWENLAPGATSGVQPYDAGLAALASFNTNGILVQTADNTFSGRTLVAPAEGFSITDADGVAGNPTFVLENDLAAVEGLATNGFAVRTGDGTWTTRSITDTAGRIVITNQDGVASAPTVDLAMVTDTTTGTFLKFTRDAYGRVEGTTAVVASDITALVDSTYVNVDGDTMTGSLTMSNDAHIVLPTPTGGFTLANHVVNKNYVDALVTGISWKEPVDSSGTTNPLTAVEGERFLNTTDGKIYTATDVDTWDAGVSPVDGWAVFDRSDETGYVFSGTNWVQFTGGGQLTAGVGLLKTGNVLDINLGAGIAELPTDEVGIDLFSPSAGAIILTTTGTDRSTASGATLHLLLKAAGGLTQDADGLYIPAEGVTNAMLANDTITIDADSGTSDDIELGQTIMFAGDSVQGVATVVSDNTITISGVDASTTQKGVASFDTSHFSVTAGAVSLSATLGDLTNIGAGVDGATDKDVLTYNNTSSKWENVTRASLLGDQSIDALSDVDTTTVAPVAGETFVFDGTNWVNRKVYYTNTYASSASWSVNHALNQRWCNVTVIDSATSEVVIPQSIVFDDANTLTVTFNASLAGRVVVMGVPVA